METILTITGLLGISISSLLWIGIKFVFKQNIEFHKILQSFPLISENRINDGSKTTINNYTQIQISKELTNFADNKKVELDVFLAKLEKIDVSKLKFKKKEITDFINNIKRLLASKAANIQIESSLELKTNKLTTSIGSESFEWCAFNYIMVDKIMKDQKQVDKMFICKILNF